MEKINKIESTKEFPKIKFEINKEEDLNMALDYLNNYGRYKEYFLPNDLKYLIKSDLKTEEKNNILKNYIDNSYKNNKEDFSKLLVEVSCEWSLIQNKYYDLMDTLFKGYKYSKEKCKAVGTIFNMCPRHISKREFFFRLDKNSFRLGKQTVGHEMLHFLFFEYLNNKYGIKEKTLLEGKESDYVWKISEAFNTVVENCNPYKDIMDNRESKPYPETLEIYEEMKKDWGEDQDIDKLLQKWLLLNK